MYICNDHQTAGAAHAMLRILHGLLQIRTRSQSTQCGNHTVIVLGTSEKARATPGTRFAAFHATAWTKFFGIWRTADWRTNESMLGVSRVGLLCMPGCYCTVVRGLGLR